LASRCSRAKATLRNAPWPFLIHLLRQLQMPVIDCQQVTAHLSSMGGRPIRRTEFLERVDQLTQKTPPDWTAIAPEFPTDA